MENYPHSREHVTKTYYPYARNFGIAAIVCFILGLILVWFHPGIATVLMVAAIILSIVAIVKRAKSLGVTMLILSVLGILFTTGILGANMWARPDVRESVNEEVDIAKSKGGIRADIAEKVEDVTRDGDVVRQAETTDTFREAVSDGDADRAKAAAEDMSDNAQKMAE